MNTGFKNRYYLLRHGKNIHQTEKANIVYKWPDDNEPCVLIEEGIAEAKAAGEILKSKQIEVIFSSDVCRTKQTAETVSDVIGFPKDKINFDERLRDVNWGIFGGKTKAEAWEFYNGDAMRKFEEPVPEGESWNECKERMIKVLDELELKYENKNILLVSHGDPLWLLESYVMGLSKEETLKNRERIITTGEVREL
jgi:broad specificity phosphatase PhoE